MSNARKRSAKSAKRASTTPGSTPASSWGRRLLVVGGGGLVLLLVAVVLFSKEPLRGIPEGTETVAVGPPAHTSERIYAADEVPAGGPHAEIWANCGFYEEPVPAEFVGHSLEHGAVWITYLPDLAEDQVARLRRLVRRDRKVLVSPVEGQDSPILATSWARQLTLDDADDPRLEQFVNEFEGSLTAPEPGGRCSGGVGQPSF